MPRTRIKFCGITRPQDASAAAAAGADAIGLLFHRESDRCVSIETAQQILRALPPLVTPVGLFVDAAPEEILEITAKLGLKTVQLHGHETPQHVQQLAGLRILKTIRVEKTGLASAVSAWKNCPNLAALLLETATAAPGGTGVENDWAVIAAANLTDTPPIIAAGGLTPINVASVVRRLRPFAVDVSSGIESSRGIKSIEKMTAFAAAVRAADAEDASR